MEKKLVSAFEQAVMPESCARKIEQKLTRREIPESRYESAPMAESRFGWLAPVAAVLALVLAVGFVLPRMQTAPEALAEVPTETQAEALQEGDVVDGKTWEFEGGAVTITKGQRYRQGGFSEGSYDTGYMPTWLIEQDGRLYFSPDGVRGEKTDITDLISVEEPYTYIYTDTDGIIHYMAVGMTHEGPFVSIEESIGFACWFRDAAEMEAALAEGKDNFHAGWLTGYSSGHGKGETNFDWYTKALEIMDIPWG